MKIIAAMPLPKVDLNQLVWQPVTERGDLAMRLAPISWQPSGAHECIQQLVNQVKELQALFIARELGE
jgi:hypothetical protein